MHIPTNLVVQQGAHCLRALPVHTHSLALSLSTQPAQRAPQRNVSFCWPPLSMLTPSLSHHTHCQYTAVLLLLLLPGGCAGAPCA
jgi:hypothetical protein